MNGKGDKRRPYDPAKWAAGYEAINWHRKEYRKVTCPWCGHRHEAEVDTGIECPKCHVGDYITP